MTDPRGQQSTLLYRLSPSEYPPQGGWIVANSTGTGRLRQLDGPSSIAPPDAMALAMHEVVLALDGVPLLRLQASECPTCEQLLQGGCGPNREIASWTEAINQITTDALLGADDSWIGCLAPVIELLPAGLYLLALDNYFPTDGSGRFFWTAFPRLRRCDALFSHNGTAEVGRPAFLAPTQPTAGFRPLALDRAGRSFRTHPGLALHLSGKMSALLDGHHRALCAAREQAAFPCITIDELRWPRGQLGERVWRSIPSAIRDRLEGVVGDTRLVREVDQTTIDRLVSQVEAIPPPELPASVAPAGLEAAYPDVTAVIGAEILGGPTRQITDERIEDVLAGRLREHFWYGELVPLLLRALFGFHDPRAVPTAIRMARDFEFRPYWELTFRLLSTRRSAAVDDFFVEFLCAADQPERPELMQIVDDYFRQGSGPT